NFRKCAGLESVFLIWSRVLKKAALTGFEGRERCMFREIDTKNVEAVRKEVTTIYQSIFPGAGTDFIAKAFGWAEDCFAGRHAEYQAIDAKYHDFEHTLQVTL